MKRFHITVEGKTYDVCVEEVVTGASAPTNVPQPMTPPAPAPAPVAPAPDSSKTQIHSPMPGNILSVQVEAGQTVKAGQPLLVLEAMKMENDIVAPINGKVTAVHVKKGDSVDVNALLVSLS